MTPFEELNAKEVKDRLEENELKMFAGLVSGSIGVALRQTYEKVNGKWWLFSAGKPARELKDDEVEWHMLRRHKPFITDGIDCDDPHWWDDPVISDERPAWWPDDWAWPPILDSDIEDDLEARQQAIDELVAAYVAKFGEQPDNVTGMVIRSSVQRVLDGDPYEWVQQGPWRKLSWV